MVNLTEKKSKPDNASGDQTEASEQESKCEASESRSVPLPDSGNRSWNALALKKNMAAEQN